MADRIALMRAGRIAQVGPPAELYFNPHDAFVAAFFGDLNRFAGTVRDGRVETPLGTVPADGLADGTAVEVLIRPEALRLHPTADKSGRDGAVARVMAARMLGRSSLIHLSVPQAAGGELHLHARIPGRFLPQDEQLLEIQLDRSQTFVFPAG